MRIVLFLLLLVSSWTAYADPTFTIRKVITSCGGTSTPVVHETPEAAIVYARTTPCPVSTWVAIDGYYQKSASSRASSSSSSSKRSVSSTSSAPMAAASSAQSSSTGTYLVWEAPTQRVNGQAMDPDKEVTGYYILRGTERIFVPYISKNMMFTFTPILKDTEVIKIATVADKGTNVSDYLIASR